MVVVMIHNDRGVNRQLPRPRMKVPCSPTTAASYRCKVQAAIPNIDLERSLVMCSGVLWAKCNMRCCEGGRLLRSLHKVSMFEQPACRQDSPFKKKMQVAQGIYSGR